MNPVSRKRSPVLNESVLRLVIEGTVSGTGVDFFRPLVRNLSTALATSGAWVTEYNPATRTLAKSRESLTRDFVRHGISGRSRAAVVFILN